MQGADHRLRHAGRAGQDGPIGVLSAAWNGEARAIIQLGLGLLIATPVARVAFSLHAFLRQRDALYVAVSGVVLIILLLKLFSR